MQTTDDGVYALMPHTTLVTFLRLTCSFCDEGFLEEEVVPGDDTDVVAAAHAIGWRAVNETEIQCPGCSGAEPENE